MNNVLGYGLPDVEFNYYNINCLIDDSKIARIHNPSNSFEFEKAYYYGAESCIPCIVDKTNGHVFSVSKNGEYYIISDMTWCDLEEFEDWFNNL